MEGSTSSAFTLGCVLGNSSPSDVALAVILVQVVAMTTAIVFPTSLFIPVRVLHEMLLSSHLFWNNVLNMNIIRSLRRALHLIHNLTTSV